jgi:hypothetical protein
MYSIWFLLIVWHSPNGDHYARIVQPTEQVCEVKIREAQDVFGVLAADGRVAMSCTETAVVP